MLFKRPLGLEFLQDREPIGLESFQDPEPSLLMGYL